MPRPKSDQVQINLSLPGDWVDAAEEYAEALSEPGAKRTRSDVLRMAIARGLPSVKAEAEARKRKR